MCTREELNKLIKELFFHVDRAAVLGAQIQFKQEQKSQTKCKSMAHGKSSQSENRLKKLIEFQKAFFKYLIFALDPYTEIIVPISSSSVALFMTNVIKRMTPRLGHFQHTSRTIVEFLQVSIIPRLPLTFPYEFPSKFWFFVWFLSLFSSHRL